MPSSIENCISDLGGTDDKQAAAAEQLAHMGEEARPAIVALVRSCESQNEEVLNWSTAALEGIGPPETEQIGELLSLAASKNVDVAYWAVTLLGRGRVATEETLKSLLLRLADDTAPVVQARAAWALGRLGSDANTAVESLQMAAESSDQALASQAKRAITQIQSD